ncbi:hypothetical protein WCLP8_2770008 [uncultured Gammaproteobacteria bacterium]
MSAPSHGFDQGPELTFGDLGSGGEAPRPLLYFVNYKNKGGLGVSPRRIWAAAQSRKRYIFSLSVRRVVFHFCDSHWEHPILHPLSQLFYFTVLDCRGTPWLQDFPSWSLCHETLLACVDRGCRHGVCGR